MTGLANGTHNGKITITSTEASNSPVEVSVTLTINEIEVYPNDALFGQQWSLAKTEAPAGWDVTKGSSDVVIAVIDSGIDFNHPDLAEKVDTTNDYDYINDDEIAIDDNGHGTHVAGIAAAATNNGRGIAGACPECQLMAFKVLDESGSGNFEDPALAVITATNQGASVINTELWRRILLAGVGCGHQLCL